MMCRICNALMILLLGVIACEPVFVIGWKETIFITGIVLLLIGPPIYRFIRKFEKTKKQNEK